MREQTMRDNDDYDRLPQTIAEYGSGIRVQEWPNRHDDRRYTVLHPACGVNIHPSADERTADRKAQKHARTCGK
jgi:hypothetical protein